MNDKHLNLFYTYNRDTELIENNLTRAFIVFLSVLSVDTRREILSILFDSASLNQGESTVLTSLDFSDARFALQSHADWHFTRRAGRKLLVTIATEPFDVASIETPDPDSKARATDVDVAAGRPIAIPDAWILDEERSYCILIEVKAGSYPLDVDQLQAHARDWLNSDLRRLQAHGSLYSLTWIEVLTTLRDLLDRRHDLVPSETNLIGHLIEFLGYFGYRVFDGITFGELHDPPRWAISSALTRETRSTGVDLHLLEAPPNFRIMGLSSDRR